MKVIPLIRPPDSCEEALHLVLSLHREGKIANLHITYDVDDATFTYWFANSAVKVLGMLTYAMKRVGDYIDED